MVVLGQALQDPVATPTGEAIQSLQHLGWVDVTALSVVATFLVLGLFQGIVWQVSRIAILLIAYGLSSHLAHNLSTFLLGFTQKPGEPASQEQVDTAYYVACVLIFLLTLIVLSLLTRLLQHLVRKAGMSFFDRLGGGIVGMATGAVLVLVGLTAVFMFVPGSSVAQAAESSRSLKVSRWAVQQLGSFVPPELQKVFPEEGSPTHAPLDAAEPTPLLRDGLHDLHGEGGKDEQESPDHGGAIVAPKSKLEAGGHPNSPDPAQPTQPVSSPPKTPPVPQGSGQR
jgi:uncharacterized membrane protein required for colicin V production